MTTLLLWASMCASTGLCQSDSAAATDRQKIQSWSSAVTIHRDEWGVPHIDGPTDAAVVFGFAFAQCEDFFWQVEDTYIQALGRYAEVAGESGLRSDLLNRAFQIVPKSQRDYAKLEPEVREICEAFVAGLNFYLEKNPDVKPRLIRHFEPWHVLAYCRQLNLTLDLVHAGVSWIRIPRVDNATAPVGTSQADWSTESIRHMGSNAWAIGPSRTKSKRPILLINPHQPWFGYGQFYEAHLKSGEGWNFTGACFFGFPLPSVGHNEHLGWAFTFNEPNILQRFNVTFDDPHRPLTYRDGPNRQSAAAWRETIHVALAGQVEARTYEFRSVDGHPLINVSDRNAPSVGLKIACFNEICFVRQARRMVRARTLAEFRSAMAMQQLPIFNTVYADCSGNIYYLYNAIVAKPELATQRKATYPANGILRLDELPQILNPKCGYLQSCNASPYRTCDDEDNPSVGDYPYWLSASDWHDDKRRSKMSRRLLRDMHNVALDDVERGAFDTTSYWALSELPRFKHLLEATAAVDPKLASTARPYLQHLLNWDCKGTPDGTQMALCVAWYDELYGRGYPAEILAEKYVKDPKLRLQALVDAAKQLEKLYGAWKVRWSDVYRIQRHPNIADLYKLPFNDAKPSLPSQGIPGPLGVIFTQYYSPQVEVPFIISLKKRYGVVGTTYLSVVEFTDQPQGRSLLQFGSSGRPQSPHYMDQAKLLSERRLKPQWFAWDDVVRHARRTYKPRDAASTIVTAQESPRRD